MAEILVETFEVAEVNVDGRAECTEEQIALIEKLGLEGQQSLVSGDEDGEKQIVPYEQMTAEQMFVYQTNFPKEVSVGSYSRGPIPLRVLQVIAHARSMEQLDKVYIWCPESKLDKDPVLVAKQDYSTYYLLARWGSALLPYADLLKKAAAKHREAVKAKYLKIKSEVDSILNSFEGLDDIAFVDRGMPTFYDR